MPDYGLGRRFAPDDRDRQFSLRTIMPATTTRYYRYWSDNAAWLDQNGYPHCVGYAWTHWAEDGPVTQPGVLGSSFADWVYHEAQLVDEWPGQNYDGTSVRAGAKVLQTDGRIASYWWGFTLEELKMAVLENGPSVIGVNWYTPMFNPVPKKDSYGTTRMFLEIPPGASLAGGHALVVNGVNVNRGIFRLKNSWGRSWGDKGRAWIGFETMERLINEQGEICFASEIKKPLLS